MARTSPAHIAAMTTDQVQRSVHELEIHRKELELQNEALRQAQQQLQESEDRYRRLTEAVTDYVYRVRVEHGRAVETIHGASCHAVTGYTAQEFASDRMLWIAMVPPEDRAIVEQQVARILSGQDAAPIEHRIRRQDGQIRWLLSTVSPQHDDQGRLIAYDGLLRDITERRQAEEALRQLNEELEQRVDARTADLRRRTDQLAQQSAELETREREFRTLAANVPALFAYVDHEQRYRYVNHRYEELFRQPAAQIVGTTVEQLLGPRHYEFVRPRVEAALSGQEVTYEANFDFADGKHVMHVNYVPDVDEHGYVQGFFMLLTDITALKRAEQQVKRLAAAVSGGAKAHPLGIVFRYGGAVLAVVAATGLRWLLQDYFGTGVAFITFFPTVAVVALMAGGGPGVLATVLSAAVAKAWIAFGTGPAGEPLAMGLFISSGLIISTMAELLHRARRREVAVLAEQVAERKQANETLQRRVTEQTREIQLLAKAIAHLADGVVITDDPLDWPRARIRFVNEAMCRISGYTADELVGQTPRVLHGEHPDGALLGRLNSELAAGHPFLCEVVHYRKDGTPYDAEVFITPLLDSEGHRTNFVSIHRDISGRKRAEAALREGEERLRAILNTAADAIITIDRRGIIDHVNPATVKMFGFTPDELIGHNVSMLMPPPYGDEHDDYIKRYRETGEARIIGIGRELVGRRKDGSTFPADLAVSEVGELGLFTGVIRDISDRKELQKQVLEIAAEEDRWIGHELHDGIQQEVTAMELFAGTLRDSLDTAAGKELEGKTAWLFEEAAFEKLRETADKLCKGLAETHAHVQQLSHGIMPVQVDAHGLNSALAELAAATDALPNVTCRFESPEVVKVADNTTATHLYRIAQEAVNNALRHSQGDEIRIGLARQDDQLILEVSDNGVGIDPAIRMRVGVAGGKTGIGLRAMHYRAGLIGATLHIARRKEGGTRVRCIVRPTTNDQ
jgi:PAS domain S-box-containing protein